MSKGRMREQMPEVAAWVDDLRSAFGTEYINKIIAAGMRGEPVFSASENGYTIGTPVYRGSRITKDEKGNPYILVEADGSRTRYDPAMDKAEAMTDEEVIVKHADLEPGYHVIVAARKAAQKKWSNNKIEQERFVALIREAVVSRIAAGQKPRTQKKHESNVVRTTSKEKQTTKVPARDEKTRDLFR